MKNGSPVVEPGDIVVYRFPGAMDTKARPAVVVSSDEYHRARPDCILGLLTTNVSTATTTFDHILADWQEAGLHRPSGSGRIL
jgi:mRNA interferase MazF